ncbi:MAG: prolyl oligopeptidase family serine peptidase [Bacteroidales bacterium]|nr:prolyl oligopeptidase family serine peptidase [Bacteroidales bacterium]
MHSKAHDQITYKEPPKEIYDLIMAKPVPSASVNDAGMWLLLMERNTFPTVAELAEPELRIAGLRINPNNFTQSRMTTLAGMSMKDLNTLKEYPIKGLPSNLRATSIQWSPSQNKIAFVNLTYDTVDLYVIDIASFAASKTNRLPLNIVTGGTFIWIDDNSLIYKATVNDAVKPVKPLAPKGPVIQESLGKKAAARTYQDLIKSSYDEALFEFYAKSQLIFTDLSKETKIGDPAIYRSFSVSPDQKYLLLQTIDKPFSYTVPAYEFPHTAFVTDLSGKLVIKIASNPSSEGVSIGFDDAPDFPRNFSWRNDEPATVTYAKALDGGLGKSKSEWCDALMAIKISASDIETPATELFKTTMRFKGVTWGNDNIAVFYEESYANRKFQMNRYNPSSGKSDSLFARSSDDAYADIGNPLTQKNEFGRQALVVLKDKELVLSADGASDEGDMPLIQAFDITSGKTRLIWRCKAPYYEYLVKMVDPVKLTFVTARESQKEVTNYYLHTTDKKKAVEEALTFFTNPYTELEGVSRQKITYKREDGINLAGDLYLPKGYDAVRDGTLPVLIWAYPIEYKSAADASQVRGSRNTFTRPFYGSPSLWVTRGYAILDNAEMPIVGEGGKEPNDNFIPQLYLNAHAAIQALAKMGVGDSTRVAVGGHSYGAFMTVNLLAHTNLFKAGIARSGAYNRTLTPFGFQGEERTYWEAPEVYNNMSPFSHAEKIKTPLLLIHGDSDNNTGTFPLQSERLYSAIKGLGGTVRYVSLPFESHGYAAKENILHMLWETDQWLEKYVKNAVK